MITLREAIELTKNPTKEEGFAIIGKYKNVVDYSYYRYIKSVDSFYPSVEEVFDIDTTMVIEIKSLFSWGDYIGILLVIE